MFLSHHTFMFLLQKFQLQGEVPWTDTLQVGANPHQNYFFLWRFHLMVSFSVNSDKEAICLNSIKKIFDM